MPVTQKVLDTCLTSPLSWFSVLTKSFCCFFFIFLIIVLIRISYMKNAKSDTKGWTSFQTFCSCCQPQGELGHLSTRCTQGVSYQLRTITTPLQGWELHFPRSLACMVLSSEAAHERNYEIWKAKVRRKPYTQKAWQQGMVAFCRCLCGCPLLGPGGQNQWFLWVQLLHPLQ